jgi:hypothetical protein
MTGRPFVVRQIIDAVAISSRRDCHISAESGINGGRRQISCALQRRQVEPTVQIRNHGPPNCGTIYDEYGTCVSASHRIPCGPIK